MKAPRIAFFGTPLLAQVCLDALHRSFGVSLVVTKPDRECGRGKKITQSLVKEYATEYGIDVYQKADLSTDIIEVLRSKGIGLNVVVAYGKIFPGAIIESPVLGSVNLHASLLPRYRGPSPLVAAILNGEKKTGITLQKMHRRMDAGDIFVQREISIDDGDTAGDLLGKVIKDSPDFIVDGVGRFISGKTKPEPQDEAAATYCSMIKKEDGLIDWSKPAERIVNEIRAYNPWPVAHTFLDGKTLRVFRAVLCAGGDEKRGVPGEIVDVRQKEGIVTMTGTGRVGILDLQLENKRRMGYREFECGCRGLVGKVLNNTL